MMYKGHTNKIELPDRSLGLYIMENFVLELQKLGWGVGRSPSARMTRNQNPRYQGEDATPPEPVFTSYFRFDLDHLMHITRPRKITLPMSQRHLQVHVGAR
jgi:hypothetical protein